MAARHTQKEYVWVERKRILDNTGNTIYNDIEYEGMDMIFISAPVRQKRENGGYYEESVNQIIIPYIQLNNRGIIPNTHSSFIYEKDTKRWYRINGFDDYSQYPQNHCYLLYIERVELDDI